VLDIGDAKRRKFVIPVAMQAQPTIMGSRSAGREGSFFAAHKLGVPV